MIGKLGMMVGAMVILISLVGCDIATLDVSAISENLAAANDELAGTIADLQASVRAFPD